MNSDWETSELVRSDVEVGKTLNANDGTMDPDEIDNPNTVEINADPNFQPQTMTNDPYIVNSTL